MTWTIETLKPAIVCVGDELLYGEITNTNLTWIQDQFVTLGAPFQKLVTIPDHIATISLEIQRLLHDQYHPIIVTGGLGGTHDDVTREAIAHALKVEFCVHQECLDILHDLYKLEITDQRKRMAVLPKDCTLIHNPLGAPGFHLQEVYAFPGFPQMFKPMVKYIIENQGPNIQVEQKTMIYLYNTTEGVIALDVEDFAQNNKSLNVGIYGNVDSYLRQTRVKVRYTTQSTLDESVLEQFFLGIAEKHQIEYKRIS
ncbi:MAG: competence/damage-inducible protein A [Candidatus Cloacimonetes bacterium]|nr:competence/damage-inducible protein A [Candidatus Cloacimonadota bacterium]